MRLPLVGAMRPSCDGIARGPAVLRLAPDEPGRGQFRAGECQSSACLRAAHSSHPRQPACQPLACGCCARRSASHGRPLVARLATQHILCGHRLALASRGSYLRRPLWNGTGVRRSCGDFHQLPVQLVASLLQYFELSVAAIHHRPDCLFALGALPIDPFLALGGLPIDPLLALGSLPINPFQEEFKLPLASDTPARPDAYDQCRKRYQRGNHRRCARNPLRHPSTILPPPATKSPCTPSLSHGWRGATGWVLTRQTRGRRSGQARANTRSPCSSWNGRAARPVRPALPSPLGQSMRCTN